MSALLAIGWAAGLLASIAGIYLTWGNAQLVSMFPEGWRWWMPWTRFLALAVFAAIVLIHPFGAAS
jgi:hypothetical protein